LSRRKRETRRYCHCSAPGDYGKPRPAVIVQSDALLACGEERLKTISQVMIDKVLAYPRAKCGPVIGHLSGGEVLVLNTMLSSMIGLAD
jgi:mRNA interferase MazF